MSRESPRTPLRLEGLRVEGLRAEELRDVLDRLGSEAPPDEREFAARLHCRLVAAGSPPSPTWLERLHAGAAELWQELGRDARQKRTLLTGAMLGALATATAFLLLSSGHPLRDANPTSPDDETADVDSPKTGPAERKAQRAVGDRRPTRDRLGEDIGAERPERPRAAH
jgi:hypothetical protein